MGFYPLNQRFSEIIVDFSKFAIMRNRTFSFGTRSCPTWLFGCCFTLLIVLQTKV